MHPTLKPEICFYPVGSELFHVYDPTTARHFKLGRQEVGWLRCLDGSRDSEALRGVIPEEYCRDFLGHVTRMGLIEGSSTPRKFNPFKMKVLRLDPGPLIETIAPFASIYRVVLDVVTLPLAIFTLMVTLIEWPAILDHLRTIGMGPGIIVFYVVAVLAVGVIHEASHALVARSFGVKVPAVGLMVFFLHPAFYADVSGINLLANRGHRIGVLLAGVKANIVLAAFALMVALTFPDAAIGLYALMFAGLNLILVVMNLVPFVGYDGYYVFQELLDEPHYAVRALRHVIARPRGRADYLAFTALTQLFRFALICLAINALRIWLIAVWPSQVIDYATATLMIAAYPLLMMHALRAE